MDRTDSGGGTPPLRASELLTALLSSGAYFASCWSIHVNPMTRVGQVSGLAAIDLRFVLFALLPIAALVLVARHRPARFGDVTPLACAYLAGLWSAIVAGGVYVALLRTPYGLGGVEGDVGNLAGWASDLAAGKPMPGNYPPLQVHLLVWIAELRGVPPVYAIKALQLGGLLLLGPLAYACWRLVLAPLPALALGLTASLPLIETYRVYPLLTLIVFVPISLRFLRVLRYADRHSTASLLRQGAAIGAAYGVLFLLYSGWFQWSLPGLVVAGLALFPWRKAPGKGALFLGAALLPFTLLIARYLVSLAGTPIVDDFHSFDTDTDPAYFAMWRNFPAGVPSLQWPLPGELGEVGLFTVLLTIGLGAAVALGRARTVVIGGGAMLVGALLVRFHYASRMDATGLVQLYPRSSAEILYLLLVLGAYALLLAYARRRRQGHGDHAPDPSHVIGLLCALALLYLSAGSAICNRLRPKQDVNDMGLLAWRAHSTPRLGSNQASKAAVTASSVLPGDAHAAAHVLDGVRSTTYSSQISETPDHVEWLELAFPTKTHFSTVRLQRADDGAPEELVVEVWTGVEWLPRATTSLATATGEVVVSWKRVDITNRLRLRATRLGAVPGGFALRLADVQIRD